MPRLPWQLYAYTTVTVTLALVALYAAAGVETHFEWQDIWLAATLTLIFGAAARFPLLLAPKYQQELSAAPGLAAAILLPPVVAMSVCALGQLSGEVDRKNGRPAQALFNSGTAALQGGAAGLVHSLMTGWLSQDGVIGGGLGLLLAGAAYFAVGAVLIEGIVALQLEQRPFLGWWTRHAETARAEVSLLFIGGLAALIVDVRPWALPLISVPVAVIYHAFYRQQLNLQRARADQQEAEEARERLDALVEATPDFVATADATGKVQYLNAAAREILGLNAQDDPPSLDIQAAFPNWDLAVAEAAASGSWTGETQMVAADGRRPVSQVVVVHRGPDAEVAFISTIVRDITERKKFEQRLVHLANHDTLTGVFNRRRFEAELEERLSGRSRMSGPGAVLFIDLDGFKEVNDRFGHHAGDLALQGIAAALRDQVIRRGDVVARLGGDEFGLLISRAEPAEAEVVAHRALAAITEFRLDIDGQWIALGGSIGVATFETGLADADEVMAHADAAMYYAKNHRLGVVRYRAGSKLSA